MWALYKRMVLEQLFGTLVSKGLDLQFPTTQAIIISLSIIQGAS